MAVKGTKSHFTHWMGKEQRRTRGETQKGLQSLGLGDHSEKYVGCLREGSVGVGHHECHAGFAGFGWI